MEASATPLIDRIRQGDSAALAEYAQGHRLQLLAYISRNLGAALRSKVEPEDILQEITMEMLGRIGELTGSDRDPFGWLCQIAEYRLIDAHRRFFGAQKRAADKEVGLHAPVGGDQTPLVNLLVASMTTPSAAFSRNQKEIALQAAMGTLPDDAREALRMRYMEGLPTKEIAEKLGKSDVAIRVLLSRSLNKLQGLLDISQTV